jgi:hypothetical protein
MPSGAPRLGGDSSIIGKTMPLGTRARDRGGVLPPKLQFPIGGIG